MLFFVPTSEFSTLQYVAQYPDGTSIRTLKTKTQFLRRPFSYRQTKYFKRKLNISALRQKLWRVESLRNSRRRRRSVQVNKHFMANILRCLLRSKISAAQKRVGNMWYFQRNGFIFNVKILKEGRFSESLLILLEIRFVWNNGGQKHSLSIDVMCPVSGQFFLCFTESMN